MAKSVIIKITADEMKEIRSDSVKASLTAVQAEPAVYFALKKSVHWVINHTIDISEWEDRAAAIAAYLDTLSRTSKGTYFYYPWKNINPEVYGKASTLRAQCIQLKELFKVLKK